jgi:hypothetical protein
MSSTAVIVRGAVVAGLLTLISSPVASAIPSFDRKTRARFQPDGAMQVTTGELIDRLSDRVDLEPPKTLTKLVVKLPAGTKWTNRGTPTCDPEPCRKSTKVGRTYIDLIFPPPVPTPGFTGLGCHTSGSVYHDGPKRLILSSVPEESCTPLDRFTIYLFRARFADKGPELTIDVIDGPVVFLAVNVRRLIRRPDQCPKSGRWIGRVTAHYEDGTKDSVVTRQRCRR